MSMTFVVYILHSLSTDRYYVGQTNNMEDRLLRHNAGRSKATKVGRPWEVVYTESYQTRAEAYNRELQIKSWKSRKAITELLEGK